MKFKDIVVLSESPEDEALLDRVESAKDQVRATTKNIKYDDTAIDIITAVGSIVDELNNEELKQEVEYLENAVFKAKNDLESAVYGLEEPFEDLIRTLQNKIDDEAYDKEYGEESVNNEASLLNPAIDAEFINWLKAKGQDTMFPYTLGDMDNPETLEQMKQLYHQETGHLAGDGGTLKHGAPGSDRRNAIVPEADNEVDGADYSQDGMIGTPDGYYDAEQRQEAYRDLKDALGGAKDWQEDSIKDGICPECAGSGYMDGEYEDEDGNEGSECYGWGDFGCDEGEMTQRDDGLPNWAEIAKHDERQMAKANKGPGPSNEELSKLIPMLHKEYVKSGRYNAFELPSLLRQMYPEVGKHQAVEVVSDFLKNFSEGKSPHKKGTKKYKKHMAAMHAGESITAGPTKTNTRITELTPARDNSANEIKVAELIKKSIKDPKGQDAFELFAELQSENPELAELYKDVALNQYEVQLEEGKFGDVVKTIGQAGTAVAGAGLIAFLLGVAGQSFNTAKDGELGKALQAHVQQGGEDSDLAKHYYKSLDLYADQADERTLINLNIKFNPNFETNRVKYDPSRTDVENFLRKQAKLPEPTNERALKDVGADDIVTVNMGGVDREFIRKGDMWVSTDQVNYPMKFKVGSPTHKKLLNLVRTKQMARSTPSAQAKRSKYMFGETWTPSPAGKKYWWE
ncbi:hypothetical protein N9I83_01200 [bacterium]|nr:hypothetical protein [bacterium]